MLQNFNEQICRNCFLCTKCCFFATMFVCQSHLKQAPSCKLPLTTRKAVFSHLKQGQCKVIDMKTIFYSHAHKTHFQSRKILHFSLILKDCGGMCGKAVNTSTSESGCPGFKPCPSHCFFIDKELYSTLSLFTEVYKLMGTGDVVLRGNPAMDHASC